MCTAWQREAMMLRGEDGAPVMMTEVSITT